MPNSSPLVKPTGSFPVRNRRRKCVSADFPASLAAAWPDEETLRGLSWLARELLAVGFELR